MQSCMIVWFD